MQGDNLGPTVMDLMSLGKLWCSKQLLTVSPNIMPKPYLFEKLFASRPYLSWLGV